MLTAPLVIEYPFKRTTGPVVGAFLTALREGFLVGIKGADGRVLVPPTEYDPVTGEDLTEVVEVGPAGTVTTWAWVRQPGGEGARSTAPSPGRSSRPTAPTPPMLGAVDAGSIDAMRTGMTVEPVWADEREGSHHRPRLLEGRVAHDRDHPPRRAAGRRGRARRCARRPRIDYTYTPGQASSRYLKGIAQKKIIGARAEPGAKVYVPPRGADPQLGKPTTEQVEVVRHAARSPASAW